MRTGLMGLGAITPAAKAMKRRKAKQGKKRLGRGYMSAAVIEKILGRYGRN